MTTSVRVQARIGPTIPAAMPAMITGERFVTATRLR
jgi:hypothetical protein